MHRKLPAVESLKRLTMRVLLLLGMAVLTGGLAALVYCASLPYAGFEFVTRPDIGAVIPGSPADLAGLRAGDQVLSIDGQPLTPGTVYLQPNQQLLRLTVSRDEQTIPLEIDLASPSFVDRFRTLSHYLIALAFWLIGMAVLLFKPKDPRCQFFALITLLAAAALALWSIADLGLAWANMLMQAIVAAIGPLFVHYNTVFPERSDFRGKRALLAGVYGAGLILLLLSLASDLAFYVGLFDLAVELPSLSLAIEAFFLVCTLTGMGLLARTQRATASETSKRQISLVWVGMAMALLPLIVFIVVPQLLAIPYIIPTWLTLMALAFIPLSYAYAINRHDLMKLDWTVNRSVVFFLLTLVIVTLYLGLALGVQQLAPRSPERTITAVDIILVLFLAFLLGPIKHRIQGSVDRAFYGEWYDYETFVSRLSGAFKDALDMQAVVDLLMDGMAAPMHFQAAAVLLLAPGENDLQVRRSEGFDELASLSLEGSLTALLQKWEEPVEQSELGQQLDLDQAAQRDLAPWSAAGAQMWVPLVQQGRLVGLVVLGGKAADDFLDRDRRILATLAQQAAAAVVRLRLVDQLQGRIEEVEGLAQQVLALQERNLQQMAMDLHDQVLQDLFVALHWLDRAQAVFLSEHTTEAYKVLKNIIGYLRGLLFELRPPAWQRSGLRKLLEDYALDFEERHELGVIFESTGDGDGLPAPEEVKVALYRILQESLNNAWKHAQAQEVLITLDLQPDRVTLAIHDDGKGFEVPSHLGGPIKGGHLGLIGMRERAARVGGSFNVESEPGEWTRVLVQIPLFPV